MQRKEPEQKQYWEKVLPKSFVNEAFHWKKKRKQKEQKNFHLIDKTDLQKKETIKK